MRNIIKNKQIVQDSFVDWSGEGDAPAGDILVPLAVLQAQPHLLERSGKVGLKVTGDAEPETVAPFIGKVALIAIEFPKFSDGRGYSLARLLRERYQYKGELRAVGDVLRDQLFFMHRVGFDAFVIREDRCPTDALQSFGDFSVTYQGDVHDQRPIYHRRPN